MSELLSSTLEQNVYEFNSRKGADDCEYNYVGLGFDPRFISWLLETPQSGRGRSDISAQSNRVNMQDALRCSIHMDFNLKA